MRLLCFLVFPVQSFLRPVLGAFLFGLLLRLGGWLLGDFEGRVAVPSQGHSHRSDIRGSHRALTNVQGYAVPPLGQFVRASEWHCAAVTFWGLGPGSDVSLGCAVPLSAVRTFVALPEGRLVVGRRPSLGIINVVGGPGVGVVVKVGCRRPLPGRVTSLVFSDYGQNVGN